MNTLWRKLRPLIGHGRRDGERVSGQENSMYTGLDTKRERQGSMTVVGV